MARGHRLQFIDAARGSAMLFVLISHFGYTFFPTQTDTVPLTMRLVGMVASPTFAAISGLLIGFLYRTHASGFDRIRIMLADRGLFLLTIGHAVIYWSHPARLAGSLFLTDTIGACMIVCPLLVPRIRPRLRLVVSLSAYLASWVVLGSWHPHGLVVTVLKETLFGTLDQSVYGYAFPLVPWFSLDFACSALGDRLGVHYASGDSQAMQRLLGWTMACASLAALTLKAAHLAAKYVFHAHVPWLVTILTAPFQKQPPSLVYFLFYGSIGLGLVSMWLLLERRGWAPRARARAVALGQASLFVLVMQWYLYFPILAAVRGALPYATAWPAYFIASVLVIILPALLWRRRGYDRFVTVGYRAWYERRAQAGDPRAPVPLPGPAA
jgi:hypothetical protein